MTPSNTRKTFSFIARWKSITIAFTGLIDFFRKEHNALIHLISTVIVCWLSFFLSVSKIEGVALVIVIGFVWSAEIFNTAIESVMDFLHPTNHDAVRRIKDVSAAAVLVASITALITGALIFIPKF